MTKGTASRIASRTSSRAERDMKMNARRKLPVPNQSEDQMREGVCGYSKGGVFVCKLDPANQNGTLAITCSTPTRTRAQNLKDPRTCELEVDHQLAVPQRWLAGRGSDTAPPQTPRCAAVASKAPAGPHSAPPSHPWESPKCDHASTPLSFRPDSAVQHTCTNSPFQRSNPDDAYSQEFVRVPEFVRSMGGTLWPRALRNGV
ncbi:uncharacterized protein BDZ99DRAFT_126719 [Mytilinidion resinicola]|uniref:Uncharacterized protein n=1 Tax=Mytilinidion resinicola TaxID=574789 RepID=A0A6A6Z4P1_9PEZI|nr:uncharacterized protein BDZ99DRAFT_126719 [Mytilinidion resinicola]KAF2815990.1 hypothetical protein BDZ99DRAFT_126719 [Mytilinidion resinicola]